MGLIQARISMKGFKALKKEGKRQNVGKKPVKMKIKSQI